MRKLMAGFLLAVMVFTLTACGSSNGTETQETTVEDTTEADTATEAAAESAEEETTTTEENEQVEVQSEDGGNDVLVAYFSRTGENYGVGVIEKGNTAIIAEMIAEQTDGELFEIRTVEAYPEDYDETTEIAQQELRENARPELAENLDSIDAYQVIYLGYPNWWGDMPMAVYTFLESHDFSGKTIIPFCTHAGSGLSGTESSIADTTGAEVLDGLAIAGTTAQNSQDEAREAVTEWLGGLDLAEE